MIKLRLWWKWTQLSWDPGPTNAIEKCQKLFTIRWNWSWKESETEDEVKLAFDDDESDVQETLQEITQVEG